MLRCFTIYWSANRESTKVKITKDFNNSDWVLKADVINDAIHELTDLYEKHIKEYNVKEKQT